MIEIFVLSESKHHSKSMGTVFREPDSITYYYVVGALVAACVLLIRLYAEGIRGYCAMKTV
jgi:hypothetical protein